MHDAQVVGSVVLAALTLYHVVMVCRSVRAERHRRAHIEELVVEPDLLHEGSFESQLTLVLPVYLLAFLVLWGLPGVVQTLSADYQALRGDQLGEFVVSLLFIVALWVTYERWYHRVPWRKRRRRVTDT